MRRVEYNYYKGYPEGCASIDWKEPPIAVLEQVDALLAEFLHSMEIVIMETGDDSIVFTIEPREEKA